MNNSYIQLAEKFLSLERENHLFDIRIKGHPFWEYMRYSIFEEINRAKSQVKFPVKKRVYLKKLYELALYFVYRFMRLVRKRKEFDLLLLTHTRTAWIDGKNVYFHVYPIAKALSPSYKVMIAHRHEFPICKSDYPCPVLTTRPIFLFSRLKSLFIRFTGEDRSTFTRLSALINKTFGTQIDIHSLAKSGYVMSLACYREFLAFFKTYKPSIIIYCDSGEMKPILEAAHQVGIKAVDYQHGIISPVSLLYRYPENFSLSKVKETNADYVFTFGDYWHPFFRTPSQPISVGFPYFDLCKEKPDSPPRDEKSILITSVMSSRKPLSQLAVDLATLLPDYTIYFKRRPEEHDSLESIYPADFSKKNNLVIIEGSQDSLYDYFARCQYLVSTNSMTLYEGRACGLITFVLKTGWYDEVKEFYEQKYASLVSSAKDIVASINNRKEPLSFLPEDHLFKKNSLRHIESFLNSLLKKDNNNRTYLR